MSTASVTGRADGRIHRRVAQVMGMPISLALRGRHAASAAGEAWDAVIKQVREVDLIFSTYREDSIINRLERGDLTIQSARPRWLKCSSSEQQRSNCQTARSRSTSQLWMAALDLIPVGSSRDGPSSALHISWLRWMTPTSASLPAAT